jgi:hypothetical protein
MDIEGHIASESYTETEIEARCEIVMQSGVKTLGVATAPTPDMYDSTQFRALARADAIAKLSRRAGYAIGAT